MKKKLLAIFTAAAMMVAGVTTGALAAGDGSKSVKVNYSCSSNNSFQMVDEELTVKNDLAETVLKNDYPEVAAEEADEVTVLDVLVAAHIKKYGDDVDSIVNLSNDPNYNGKLYNITVNYESPSGEKIYLTGAKGAE